MKKIYCVVFAIFICGALMAKKPPFTVTFGSGGGFTGLTTTYSVTSKRVFSKIDNVSKKTEALHKVKCKDVKSIRKLLANVNFSTLNINKSGNISSFITLSQDGKEFKTEWTGATSGNPALDELHKKLVSLIPAKK
jgi:hypothetical protein